MIRLLAVIPILALAGCNSAPTRSATPASSYDDMAEVTHVEPLYESVRIARPVTECWTEEVSHRSQAQRRMVPAVAGGIIGGVIGHMLGGDRRRTPLTVGGALAGAAIGHSLSRRRHSGSDIDSREVRRCAEVNRFEQREEVSGYLVEYRYEGRTYTTRMRHHPGRYVPMQVHVDPADGG